MTQNQRWSKWYHSDLKKHRAADRARYRRRVKEGTELKRCRLKAAKLRIKLKALIKQTKEVPCTDCGMRHPYYVMDFDHVRGEKKFELARGKWGWPLSWVKAEIAKCDVVCSNCHREREWQRRRAVEMLGCPWDYFKWAELMPV